MVNERTEMLDKSATLYFGPWYKRSPYFDKTREAGCTAYDIYNHTYLPAYYDDPIVEYWALINDVTMWDVAVERTVEIAGKDADKLMNMITCRDLSDVAVHQGKYAPIIQRDGGIVNDPVLLHPKENVWWMQLADSDAGFLAEGVAASSGLEVEVNYPDVYPMQIQGAKAAQTVEKLAGEGIYDLKYYWTGDFEIDGIPVVISRTGWTAVQGFEINLLGYDEGGRLWDAVAAAGEEFGMRPIAPCEARRIEAGIFNWGSDMNQNDTPWHVSGLERLVEEQEADYVGKAALERLRAEGVDRKLVGIRFPDMPALRAELSRTWDVFQDGKQVGDGRTVGRVTDAIWSPRLGENIGYVWVPIELAEPGTALEILTEDGERLAAETAALPFMDPRKEVPAGELR